MLTLVIAVGSFVGYLIAYHTYGRWLSRRLFGLRADAPVPSRQLRDDRDYVPTRRSVLFGHHFSSIAGTGPIVGPALAVIWGWLPALLWVLFGAVFIGAVHDLSVLVISMRNRGQTIGDAAGRLINPRVKILFLLILLMALAIVLAVFGLVIATIFDMFPASVLSLWVQLPMAMVIGWLIYRKGYRPFGLAMVALAVMIGAIILAVLVPDLQLRFRPFTVAGYTISPVVTWTVILLIYCYFASIVPVWQLLQPRDYINSFILLLCLGLLVAGVAAATLLTPGGARLVAPAVRASPAGAPPIIPFLFVTVACGAISGFHCLVSSGTSSKQIASEPDAQFVAYGSMLTEGFLAVLVILACCAGLGLGSKYTGSWRAGLNGSRQVLLLSDADGLEHRIIRQADTGQILTVDGQTVPPRALPQSYDLAGGSLIVEPDNDLLITGRLAWMNHYRAWGTAKGLGAKLGAFIHGGANLASSLGIPIDIAVAVVAVMVTCFAATTLDTATRLERYVIQELASTARIRPLQGKHAATLLAVGTAGALAIAPPPGLTWAAGMGKGGLTLWPIFGAVNQLLAGLAFLVIVFHLLRRRKPLWFIATPAALMLLVPITAMLMQIFRSGGWWRQGQWHLVTVGLAVCALQLWMVGEALRLWPKIRGILEPPLPPLDRPAPTASSSVVRKQTAG